MDEPIIEMKNLTMRFAIERRHYGMKNILLHLPQYLRDKANKKWHTALDNFNLSIHRGERVALVGHNGCGKTTTLSVIGGVYRRYQGECHVRGRVSMMLALGAGFCRELSGRENIVLNGVFQGKTRREMNLLMDDIIDFADLGDYIDAPIYQYSSGMLARLGFGIATAIKPDILLVDEVMAVGDANFREKCVGRIQTLLDGGTTLVLVSHNTSDIKRYCERVIKIDHGRIIADGPTAEIMGEKK